MVCLLQALRQRNCSGPPSLNPRPVFTAYISIRNTALWTQRVMPIEKQSFSQQSTAITTLIECVRVLACVCAWLCIMRQEIIAFAIQHSSMLLIQWRDLIAFVLLYPLGWLRQLVCVCRVCHKTDSADDNCWPHPFRLYLYQFLHTYSTHTTKRIWAAC